MKKLMIIMLTACMCMVGRPMVAKAAVKAENKGTVAMVRAGKKVKLKAPKPTKCKFWKSAPKDVTGSYYRSTWKRVKGATGYKVQYVKMSGSYVCDKGSTTTKKCSWSFGTSEVNYVKLRVRAYKKVGNKKVYGPYSKWVKGSIDLR